VGTKTIVAFYLRPDQWVFLGREQAVASGVYSDCRGRPSAASHCQCNGDVGKRLQIGARNLAKFRYPSHQGAKSTSKSACFKTKPFALATYHTRLVGPAAHCSEDGVGQGSIVRPRCQPALGRGMISPSPPPPCYRRGCWNASTPCWGLNPSSPDAWLTFPLPGLKTHS
jgi:hypothetical protein